MNVVRLLDDDDFFHLLILHCLVSIHKSYFSFRCIRAVWNDSPGVALNQSLTTYANIFLVNCNNFESSFFLLFPLQLLFSQNKCIFKANSERRTAIDVDPKVNSHSKFRFYYLIKRLIQLMIVVVWFVIYYYWLLTYNLIPCSPTRKLWSMKNWYLLAFQSAKIIVIIYYQEETVVSVVLQKNRFCFRIKRAPNLFFF